MNRPTRQLPAPGMRVGVVHLGVTEHAVIEAVLDGGRTLVVDGERFTLRSTNARFVREGEPYYGTRLAIGPDAHD
jgi:hypothetical protein